MVYASYVPGQKPQQQQQQQQQNSYAPQYAAAAPSTNAYAPAPSANAYAPAPSANAYAPAPSTNAYASAPSTNAYAPAPSANVYAPAPSTNAYAPAPSTNAYAPAPSTNTYASAPSTNAYAPAPSTNVYAPQVFVSGQTPAASAPSSAYSYGNPSSSYSYGNPPKKSPPRPSAPSTASAPVYRSPAPASRPDFSLALDVPPPQPQQVQALPAPTAPQGYGAGYGEKKQGDAAYGGGGSNNNTYPVANAVSVTDSIAIATGTTNSQMNSSVYTGGPTHGLVSEGNPTQCNKVDYEIKGNDMQLVEIELDPSETVIAEAGAMMYLEDGIDFKAKFGDGSTPKQGFWKKIMSAGGRLLTGESLFVTHFSNKGHTKARVAFAAPYPGTIIPVNMANIGGKLICQKDAFLCAALGTKLSIHLNKKIGSGLFGGEGFILQKLKGDGMAFVHAGGTVIKKELKGQRLRLDTGCLVAYTDGINCDIQLVPGLKSMFFGGEGLFLATLQGTGTVWIQSLPFSRMADRIIQSAPSAGGQRKGEGSALTGAFGGILDGDGF